MFRVVLPPIIRSAYNSIYSIWYLSHRYCYLPLSWESWNRFECAVGGFWWWAVCRSKHVVPSVNGGIINSIKRLHLVGYFSWGILRCMDPWILNVYMQYNVHSHTRGMLLRHVCPSVNMYHLGSHWTHLREISYWGLPWKSIEIFQIWSKSDRSFMFCWPLHLGIIFVNNQLDARFFFMYVYSYSLRVSDSHLPIARRINCINTSGICHSVYMTVWCAPAH
jgi:hypothetical protein